MLKNIIVLPDGTEIASGLDARYATQSSTITSSVNSSTDLTPGSVCSAALEVKCFAPDGDLSISVGTEITLYKETEDGVRHQIGLFTVEEAERTGRNTYHFTAYDRISWLDKDLTEHLASMTGWPFTLFEFAKMVCNLCGLTMTNTGLPNGTFPVNKFPASKITGRELIGYIGQIAGRFCRATAEGGVEFAWYEDSGVTIQAMGDRYYFSLKQEDYQVQQIDAVQVSLASSEYGALFPEVAEGANSYVISGNPLITVVNESLLPYLDVLKLQLEKSVYTPCRVTLPANVDIRPGHTLRIIDGNGNELETYVMTKTQSGQKETLESTGNARRDRPTALKKNTADYVDAALKRQTQLDIFNKLTNYGAVQGMFLEENGQIYVNAAYISTGILQSKDGKTFYLDLDQGILTMDAKALSIGGKSLSEDVLDGLTQEELVNILTAEGAANGIYLTNGQLYINADYLISGTLNASMITAGILQSKDGETFKLDLDNGTFSMAGSGKFMAPDGKSYITVENGQFVLHAQSGEYGEVLDIVRIGFTEDSEGLDYPYLLLGNSDEEGTSHDKIGLIKMFKNGLYVGNSAPRQSSGSFVGLPGAAGFFIDTSSAKAYVVQENDMKELYTGTVDATFA